MAVPAAFGHNTNHTQLLHPPSPPPPLSTKHHASALAMGNGNSSANTNNNGTLAPSHAWFVPGYVATMGHNSTGGGNGSGGGRGGAAEMRPQQGGGAANGTGFFMEEESAAEGFSDFTTVVISCLATLAPLVVLVLGIIAFRMTYKYLKQRREDRYDGVTDSSCENMERPLHSHLLNCDKKYTDAHLELEGEELCGESASTASQMVKGNNHSSTNGSIITMTLKNNHLIVETEERNDLEEDCRETTMKYSPNARDGVFVVEVQQGVRRSPPVSSVAICTTKTATASTTTGDYNFSDQKQKQQALIHKPPDRFSEESTDTTTQSYSDAQSQQPPAKSPSLLTTISYAGLATSNQSLSTDVHYSYGNQEEYNNGRYGYPVHSGVLYSSGADDDEHTCQTEGWVEDDQQMEGFDGADDGDRKRYLKQRADSTASVISYKPKITSAIYKNRASVDLLTDIDHSKLVHSNSVIVKPSAVTLQDEEQNSAKQPELVQEANN